MVAKKTTRKKNDAQKIMNMVEGLNPQTVIEEIGTLQNSLQGTLAGLSAQISSKIEQMRGVEEAISLKRDELQELFGIEKEAMSLEDMRALREDEENSWEKSKFERQLKWNEDEEERTKRWKREDEEHAYMISQRSKRSQEEYNVEIQERRRSEAVRQQDLEREWQDREDALAEREQELVSLREEVDGFNEKLKAEVQKAEAVVGNSLKREYENRIQLLQKDIDAEKNLHAIKVSAMDETINGLHEQIQDLQKQLEIARNDAKEVTKSALESASGRQAMKALQRNVKTPSDK